MPVLSAKRHVPEQHLDQDLLMKIVLVHNTYQQAGGEDVVFEQEKALLERAGHRVATYCRSNHEISELSAIERAMVIPNTIWSSDSHRAFAQLLRRENPQVVHIHNTFMMISPSIYSACRDQKVPVVQTLHNFRLLCPAATFFRDGKVCEECVDDGLWKSVSHGCYRDSRSATATVALMLAVHRKLDTWNELVDRFIALSDFSRDKFVTSGFPAKKIVVKPNFVAPDPGPRDCDGEYALFIGRLSREKGLPTLVEGWTRLKIHMPLQIIGDGPERQSLEAQVNAGGVCSITFRGRCSHVATLGAVKRAKFVVLPSECYENFPMSIVEAFACGTPVICSRLGGMAELVDDYRTGLLFTPGDPDALAEKVQWAATHPAELAEMGREARREFERRYTAEKNYSDLMDIYEGTMHAYA
jgi:glycosyltransferase involved in cell wall biosynthesis